jgi:hypothetical protein
MPACKIHSHSLVLDRQDRQYRDRRSDARHVAALQKNNNRFEDVSPAELAFERLTDTTQLPPPETPIASMAQLCIESPLAGLGVDPDEAAPLHLAIQRRLHPFDRRTAKVPA